MRERMAGRAPKGARGFTITELLVVLGVIGVLLAITLPALWGARESAKRVACATNLHSFKAAFRMYADDHRGLLPYADIEVSVADEWLAPLDALARYLDVPLPTVDLDALRVLTHAPFLCPGDARHGPYYGFSYYYLPLDIMKISRTPEEGQRNALRAYERNPREPVMIDRMSFHPKERNALHYDGSIAPPRGMASGVQAN